MKQDVTIDGVYVAPTTALTTVADGTDGVFVCGRECRAMVLRNKTAGRLYWQMDATAIVVTEGKADFLEAGESIEIACLSFTSVCVHPVGAAAVFSGGTPTAALCVW